MSGTLVPMGTGQIFNDADPWFGLHYLSKNLKSHNLEKKLFCISIFCGSHNQAERAPLG